MGKGLLSIRHKGKYTSIDSNRTDLIDSFLSYCICAINIYFELISVRLRMVDMSYKSGTIYRKITRRSSARSSTGRSTTAVTGNDARLYIQGQLHNRLLRPLSGTSRDCRRRQPRQALSIAQEVPNLAVQTTQSTRAITPMATHNTKLKSCPPIPTI